MNQICRLKVNLMKDIHKIKASRLKLKNIKYKVTLKITQLKN